MTKNNAKIVNKSYDLGNDDSKSLDQSENARKQKHKFKKVLVNSKLKPEWWKYFQNQISRILQFCLLAMNVQNTNT